MPRKGRQHTRLTYAASVTWAQAKIVILVHWRWPATGAAIAAALTFALALSEPPHFRSSAFLKGHTFLTGQGAKTEAIKDTDVGSVTELLDQQIKINRTPEFAEELSRLVTANPELKDLMLTWGVSQRFRIYLMLHRLHIAAEQNTGLDITTLKPSELASLFLGMATIEPIYSDSLIRIQVESMDENTAGKVADVLADAYVATSIRLEGHSLALAIAGMKAQSEILRKRLIEAEGNLKQFFKENPLLASDSSKRNVAEELTSLSAEADRLASELDSNLKLLEFYKKRFSSFSQNSDATTEVYDKFKQELIQLKYQRQKFIFEGYPETHPGILELDGKIAIIQKALGADHLLSTRRMVSVGHEQKLSEKIVELQDLIKKEQIDLEAVKHRRTTAAERSKTMPEQEMLLDDFQREVRISKTMFEEISRRLELATMRKAGGDGPLVRADIPGGAVVVPALPTGRRVAFAMLIGFLLGALGTVVLSVLGKKVVDEDNVHAMGVKYAGNMQPGNFARAKILSNLGCKYREEDSQPAIVLCCSPATYSNVGTVLLLTEYLALQKEKAMLIVVGEVNLGDQFVLRSDLGYARIFVTHDNAQFVIQITDAETIYSVRDCLAITEQQYKIKFTMVFLYLQDGADCLTYPYGQQLADKMLLIGRSAESSAREYLRLVDGFKDFDEVYVALTASRGLRLPFLQRGQARA